MTQDKDKIDWSEERWKEMLISQRKFQWFEDTVAKFAVWLELKPGMTALDVGCGLGFLGYTYWSHFGQGGRYLGVDTSLDLLRDAAKATKEWAADGETFFTAGDAYKLPFDDSFADWVMCQTLLMHLEKPELALAEMVRVVRPGGLIMCQEPDNLSSMLAQHHSSVPELDVEDLLLCARVSMISNKGRMKLGEGDHGIGPKVPHMMKEQGLIDIDIRLNDRVFYLEPPYIGPIQQHRLKMVKKNLLNDDTHRFWMNSLEKEFLAGGGNPKEFERYRDLDDRVLPIYRQQLEDGQYFSCSSHDFYIVKGRKPKRR